MPYRRHHLHNKSNGCDMKQGIIVSCSIRAFYICAHIHRYIVDFPSVSALELIVFGAVVKTGVVIIYIAVKFE
jgi:hypothetical protein